MWNPILFPKRRAYDGTGKPEERSSRHKNEAGDPHGVRGAFDRKGHGRYHRNTFYNNYRGVYELVDELENEVIRTFDTAMQEIDFVENPYAVFMKLTEIINSDMDFYGALLRSSRNAGLTHKIRLTLQQKAQERFESRIDLPPERISVMMDYAVSGMVAVYQSWFNSERRQSIEEISDIASRMCLTGLRGAAADARLKE